MFVFCHLRSISVISSAENSRGTVESWRTNLLECWLKIDQWIILFNTNCEKKKWILFMNWHFSNKIGEYVKKKTLYINRNVDLINWAFDQIKYMLLNWKPYFPLKRLRFIRDEAINRWYEFCMHKNGLHSNGLHLASTIISIRTLLMSVKHMNI